MTVTTAPPRTAPTRRRSSTTPGHYTRAQVEEILGLSPTERDTFERAGILGPTTRRARGDTRPLLYSAVDLALGRMAMDAHALGLRGEQLRRIVEAVRLKSHRMAPGWTGLVLVDAHCDVDLVPAGADLAAVLTYRATGPALLTLRVHVPELSTS